MSEVCECGHGRDYHATEAGNDGFVGHYCEYEGCDCVDFIPYDETEDGDQ